MIPFYPAPRSSSLRRSTDLPRRSGDGTSGGPPAAIYQLVRLPAYSVHRTKRLLKAPKLYWCDTGLALNLAGETEPRGAHLENLILTDLLAWLADGVLAAPWWTVL